jgi:opacity protein-like surface antigen
MSRIAATLLLLLIAPAAIAQISEVTPFAGYQTGGAVTLNGLNTGLDDAAAFGVVVTFDRGRGRKLDVLLSHEQTRAARRDPFVPPVSADVALDYLQIGGRYAARPEQRTAPYVAMTIGATRMAIESASAVRFSYAFGAGADIRLTPRTSLRLDGRFHTTLVQTNAQIGCSSGATCTGFGTSTALTQFTAGACLVIRL